MTSFEAHTFQRRNIGICPMCEKTKENKKAAYCYTCMKEYRRNLARRKRENIAVPKPKLNVPEENTAISLWRGKPIPDGWSMCPKCNASLRKLQHPTCFKCHEAMLPSR